MTLAQLPVGKEGVIETVGGEGNLRCRFLDMGLIPGTKVKCLKWHRWEIPYRFIFADMILRFEKRMERR